MSKEPGPAPSKEAPKVAVPDADAEPAWPMKFKLRKKINDKDAQLVEEISLREPTGGDIAACGNPVTISVTQDNKIEFQYDETKMTKMLANLAGIPETFFKQIDPRDWNTLAFKVNYFFIPDLSAL